MTLPLDEDIVQRVNDLGVTRWSGTTYRFTSKGRDARSGEGLGVTVGGGTPVGRTRLSTSRSRSRRASRSLFASPPRADYPWRSVCSRELSYTLAVSDLALIDLRPVDALDQVGLSADDISDTNWTACQTVGQAAYFLGHDGIIAPSATGRGVVLTVFESRIDPGKLTVNDSHTLTAADLPATE